MSTSQWWNFNNDDNSIYISEIVLSCNNNGL